MDNILIMYIYNTLEEAQAALEIVNTYFGLPCGETLNWTNIEEGDGSSKTGYEYLLRLQVRTFTSNKVKQLKNDIDGLTKKLNDIQSTSEKKMWLQDLKEFEIEYVKWLKIMSETKKEKNPPTQKTITKKK